MEPIRGVERHPLQNDLILSIIMKSLSLKDLKSCRQVCKLWAVESSKKMLSSTKVTIISGLLAHFVNLVTREESFWLKAPVTSFYSLSGCGGPANNPHFWSVCGANIRRLSLLRVCFRSADVFLHEILESCPNLKQLNLIQLSFECEAAARKTEEGVPPRLLDLLILSCDVGTAKLLERHGVEILEHFPSLQNLKVVHSDEIAPGEGGGELFDSLARIRKDNPALLNLKQFEINFRNFDRPLALLPALVDSGLTLEAIKMTLSTGDLRLQREQKEVTRKLIETHAASLQELFIDDGDDDPHSNIEDLLQPPKTRRVFPQLQKLHLDQLKRMRILRLAPNLRELSVSGTLFRDRTRLRDKDIKPEVTKLRLTNPENMDLRLFARLFPNVEELKLWYTTCDQFPLVCELWPQLRSLWWHTPDCEPLTDAEITGYNEEDVERINREGADSAWRPNTFRKPNITSLTNLESFVWTGSESPPNYCAAVDGVLKLPKLKNLAVRIGRDEEHLPIWKETLHRFTNIIPSPFFGDFTQVCFE